MNFLFLGIFYGFFLINFMILNDKNNLKNAKRVLFLRGTHVAAPHGPTRRLRGDVTDAHYLYILI